MIKHEGICQQHVHVHTCTTAVTVASAMAEATTAIDLYHIAGNVSLGENFLPFSPPCSHERIFVS